MTLILSCFDLSDLEQAVPRRQGLETKAAAYAPALYDSLPEPPLQEAFDEC